MLFRSAALHVRCAVLCVLCCVCCAVRAVLLCVGCVWGRSLMPPPHPLCRTPPPRVPLPTGLMTPIPWRWPMLAAAPPTGSSSSSSNGGGSRSSGGLPTSSRCSRNGRRRRHPRRGGSTATARRPSGCLSTPLLSHSEHCTGSRGHHLARASTGYHLARVPPGTGTTSHGHHLARAPPGTYALGDCANWCGTASMPASERPLSRATA